MTEKGRVPKPMGWNSKGDGFGRFVGEEEEDMDWAKERGIK